MTSFYLNHLFKDPVSKKTHTLRNRRGKTSTYKFRGRHNAAHNTRFPPNITKASIYMCVRKRVPEKHLLLLCWLCQTFWLCGSQQTVKIQKEMGIPNHLTCLLRNLYAGQETTTRTGHGTTACSKLGKEYVEAVYCHPAYLTYMQSTSGEMLGWIKHKLESRLPGEISITSDMQMTPPLWQKVKRN